MALPRNSVRVFLTQAKAALKTAIAQSSKVTFVIGNESSDLDSLTCSILYAYIRSQTPRKSFKPAPFTDLYIPLTNIPAADISLRPEYLELLPYANLEASHLITLDDLPPASKIASQLPPESTKWILVDHNALQGTLGSIYSKSVGGVIDHHAEEHKVPKETAPEPRIIMKSGSCTSLVTEFCQESWDQISSPTTSKDDLATGKIWDAEVACLALASILIDTYNLKDETKVTPHDRKAVEYLEAKIKLAPEWATKYNRDRFFKNINDAKSNIGRLSLYDILRKDYKEWTEKGKKVGISSVVKPISFLLDKARKEHASSEQDPFLDTVQKYSEDRGLGICTVMTAFGDDDGFHRELFVWALDPDCAHLMKDFADAAETQLQLKDHESGKSLDDTSSNNTWRKLWIQGDLSKSRKQVAPLLREKMN